ncbi:hypothetical protein PAMA_017112 [Pampus argenteus]
MDHSTTNRNRKQRSGHYNSTLEPQYDVVDNQQDVVNVHILPARPIHEDKEYADRDLPRSASTQSLSSLTTGNSNVLLRCPSRQVPFIPGPAVNRNLKPGRRKIRLDEQFRPVVPPGDQHSQRLSPSPSPLILELSNQLAQLSSKESCRSGQKKATKKAEIHSHVRALQGAESVSGAYTSQRHSLDLETQQLNIRSQQNLERASSKRHHHEWPQTKEDFEQHDFVPMEKHQQQLDCEEDWYVGACSRADAEHALHLVNKDGAFLVRDCSINSNSEPLVLSVYHEKKVYNVKIRFMESTNKYGLGTGQRSNDMFDSVADIIKFHSIFPIILISGRNIPGCKSPENCMLTCPLTKRDVDKLLQ